MPTNKPPYELRAEKRPTSRRGQEEFYAQAVQRTSEQLQRAGIIHGALRVGEVAPEFTLESTDERCINLPEWLDRGPVIVTFFRGGWCPHCTLTLQALQANRDQIRMRGAELLAISLETPIGNRQLVDQLAIEFPVLSDPDGRVAHLFGVLYRVPPELAAAYREQGVDLPRRQGTHRWLLPLAATYLIDSDSLVRYAFVEADPAERADPADIVRALDQLTAIGDIATKIAQCCSNSLY